MYLTLLSLQVQWFQFVFEAWHLLWDMLKFQLTGNFQSEGLECQKWNRTSSASPERFNTELRMSHSITLSQLWQDFQWHQCALPLSLPFLTPASQWSSMKSPLLLFFWSKILSSMNKRQKYTTQRKVHVHLVRSRVMPIVSLTPCNLCQQQV